MKDRFYDRVATITTTAVVVAVFLFVKRTVLGSAK